MMRSRSRTVRSPNRPRLVGSANNPGESSNHRYEYGGVYDPDPGCLGSDYWPWSTSCSRRESIYDDNTVYSGRRHYKPVTHIKMEAARFGDDAVELHFSPPSPASFWLSLNGYMTKQPDSFTAQIPWTDLVVDLSKQVSDSIQTNFMGAVFLKEIRETLLMLRNPFGLVSSRLRRAIPRGMTAKSLSSTSELSSLWLEYRYGWNPLLSDITSFSKLLATLLNNPVFNKVLLTWSRFSKSFQTSLDCPPPSYYNGGTAVNWESDSKDPSRFNISVQGCIGYLRLTHDRTVVEANLSCEKLVPYGKAFSMIEQLSTLLGLGNWMQIRDTLWEVLPFSFVVDWFINFNNVWRPSAEARLQSMDISNLGYSTKIIEFWTPEVLLLYFGNFLPFQILPTGGRFVGISGPGIFRGKGGVTTSYQRTVGLPPQSEEVFRTHGLNLLRTLDGISLFLQRALR